MKATLLEKVTDHLSGLKEKWKKWFECLKWVTKSIWQEIADSRKMAWEDAICTEQFIDEVLGSFWF